MTATPLLAIVIISLKIPSLTCHRLITSPYQEQEWDSVIVSSDPITIREKSHNDTDHPKANEILRPQKRSYEECPENDFACLYGNDDKTKQNHNQIVDKFLEKYSQIVDLKYSESENLPEDDRQNENSRKSYWTMVDSQTHHHPYDDNKGWVTLDPVPWSTSKISKWHPNKHGIQQENKPWSYASTTSRPVQQFWVSGSSYQTQMPSAHWGIGTNDIITDNKPSDFPSGHYNGFAGVTQEPNYPSAGYPVNYNAFQQHQELQGNHPFRYPPKQHPSTYPSNNDGEWVLLSTTKGYSNPQRHRWPGQKILKPIDRNFTSRKIKPNDISKYHEEVLNEKYVLGGENPTGNRKSDMNGATEGKNETNDGTAIENPVQILYTGSPKDDEPVKTFRRKVRLQVLPSLDSSSTSHGGLLEVDSSSQTVDEAQQEDEKMQQLKAIANVKKNKIRGYKLIPVSKLTGKGMSHNVMTLAAVGAGMIPATMALLVPMALGRRKRSIPVGYARGGRISNWREINKLKRW